LETVKGKIKGNIIFLIPLIRENKGRIRERKLLGCEGRNRQTVNAQAGVLYKHLLFIFYPIKV
jgi:hypothetical protein